LVDFVALKYRAVEVNVIMKLKDEIPRNADKLRSEKEAS